MDNNTRKTKYLQLYLSSLSCEWDKRYDNWYTTNQDSFTVVKDSLQFNVTHKNFIFPHTHILNKRN